MLRLALGFAAVVAVFCATVMAQATGGKVLYDMKHHKAIIVQADGCYEYHLDHQDVLDYENDATRATLEARMFEELAMAINVQEMGHNHINHFSQEIQTACASLPIYSWEIAPGGTGNSTAMP